jgi:polyisoprenoid-binding protein YceI
MKALKYMFLALVLSPILMFSQSTEWTFDKAHSNVMFTVDHLVIAEVTGYFKSFDGKVTSNGDDFTAGKIDFTVDVKSINTDNEKRDGHLKSEDFFYAEKYPQMIFKGKELKKVGDKKYKLTGDLTIRGVTKPVSLDVVYKGTTKDAYGNTKAGFKITGEVNRFDYGLKWNTLTEMGGAVVGQDVRITVNAELTKGGA